DHESCPTHVEVHGATHSSAIGSWTDYWIRNDHESCPKGGHHEIIESSAECICKKCRLSLSERGLIDIYDKYGNEIK
ncbi:MAG: hypothetical protein II690_03665, partial [Ruminococcus sp.]|nr:hypothetical protein [Ruminococcus sp.]